MKSFGWLLVVMLVGLTMSFSTGYAFEFGFDIEKIKNAEWGIELGGVYHFGRMDMGDVKYDQRDLNNYWEELSDALVQGGLPPFSFSSDSDFDRTPFLDISFGMYWWRFHGGMMYSRIYQAGKYVQAEVSSDYYSTRRYYIVEAAAKEYIFFLGFHQPITSWLEVGIYGGMGPSSADIHQRYEESSSTGSIDSDYRYDHSANNDYIAKRIWGKVRVNATPYICVDVNVGYRQSQVENFRGVLLDGSNTDSDAPVVKIYHSNQELIFDYSGIYYGLGITLQNPL